ncbi:MAG: hypothetical protein JRH20_03130 [Deltaproteobacteria bacterium]|nr:hypothetical protein [Deltaproteobacteria bacterium]
MVRLGLMFVFISCVAALPGCYISSFDDSTPTDTDQGVVESDGEIIVEPAYGAEVRIGLGEDPAGSEAFATIAPGGSVTFHGEVQCFPEGAVCEMGWTFPDGKVPDTLEPGARTFAAGYHHIVLTARTVGGEVVGEAHAYIAAWTGELRDDFNRGSMEWDQRGWAHPVRPDVEYLIKDEWLYIKHDIHGPGSTGLMAYPSMRDAHVEVTVRRYPNPLEIHYMDVIFRAHPQHRNYRFYRVRVDQSQEDQQQGLRIAIFKVYDEEDEHGLLVSDIQQPVDAFDQLLECTQRTDCESLPDAWAKNCQQGRCVPIQCLGCAELANFDPPRIQDFRIVIDFRDEGGLPTWDVRVVDPQDTSTVFIEQIGIQDTSPNPHLHAGLVGLAQFDLETYFDDFYVRSLDP